MNCGNKKAICGTLMQIVVCELFLTGFIFSRMLGNSVFEVFCYLILPLGGAILLCFLRNKKHFKFRKENMKIKSSYVRFGERIAVILIFLVIEIVLEKLDAANWLSGKWIWNGELLEKIPHILCNLMAAFVVSVFPTTYAVVEWLFVREKELD